MNNSEVSNFDLLTLGITVASIVILGVIIYLNNKKSITNRSFLLLSVSATVWSITNYLSYQSRIAVESLWLIRIVMFSATWFAFSLFVLLEAFPNDKLEFLDSKRGILLKICVTFVSILTLTPFVFPYLSKVATDSSAPQPASGIGIYFFGITVFITLFLAILSLVRKVIVNHGEKRAQLVPVLIGTALTFPLILVFNFLFPSFLNNVKYIPYGAVFILPFVVFTFYAIYRHHLFNIKVAAIAFVAFILTVFSFFNVVYATGASQIVLNITFFVAILIGSIILIKSVLREIEQREKIEKLAEDLEKANVRLTELDRQKSEFVSFATHQLRAPLTAMKGYASLLLEGDMGKLTDDSREGISRIYDSTNTLIAIVNDYLNISRIELGAMKYVFETIDLKTLIDDVLGELKPNIEKTGLNFNFDVESQNIDYRITADRDKLKQVIANLIDNSIKYMPSGSVKVSLAFDRPRHKFVFKVKDTGIGISPEVLPHLFQKFSRADNASKTNIRGTGLGLYVAKEMIDAHHGTIRAESDGEGKGSSFIVELDPFAMV